MFTYFNTPIMKLRFIYFLMLALFAMILLQSKSSGLASQLGIDRTGSPLAGGLNCGSCHSGAFYNSGLVVTVKNASGTPVTTYKAGDAYTIEFTVSSNFGGPYRGFQGVVLDGSNVQAGNLFNPQTNTQVSTIASTQYAEHSSPPLSANFFTFIVSWTAPVPSTGDVTVYASGIASNGSNTTTGDDPTGSVSVVLTEEVSAIIDYTQSGYCTTGSDPTPTILGEQGGAFSAAPSGLVFSPSTGTIDVSASNPGQYVVSYTYSIGVATDTVSVFPTDNDSVTYSQTSYCINASDPTPVLGTPGGIFISTPATLSINSSTGEIDLSASPLGSYFIQYLTPGPCQVVGDFTLAITNLDDASFSYAASSYCRNVSDPTPTITGAPSGSFTSSPTGLSLNGSTGKIDVSASLPNTYTITYTTPGSCSNSSNEVVTINPLDDASFSYSTTAACQNGTDPVATISGLTGGAFSSTSGLSIDANSGLIDASASTPGTYNVAYTTNGTCPNSSIVSVTITATDNASFTYGGSSFCQNGTDPTPTASLPTGTWSSTAGLSINPTSGTIDVSASTANSYLVTYTTAGPCPNTSNATITVLAPDNASFSYNATTVCQNGVDPVATIGGLTGGTFSSTSGLSIDASSGLIDASASTAGTYNVTYTTTGTCPNSSIVVVTITAIDNASFTYGGSSFCQNGTDPTPTASLSTGTWSSTTGLSINPTTGTIDVSASTANSYLVTYVTAGPCPNTSSTTITILAPDNASFSYSASSYCQNGSDPTPVITGTTGTFSSTTGLAISSATGVIDVSGSTAGVYNVTYTTNGPCPNTSVVAVTITATDNPSFAYGASSYCQNGSDPTPTITGTTGTFSSSTGLSISASTGVIDVSASTPGVYNVTYTTNGPCPSTSIVVVTITVTDNASFTYGGATFCQNGSDPSPTGGLPGGTWSSTTGLSISPTTGVIDVSTSTPGNYSVTYTTNGPCPASNSMNITITATDNASYSYNATTSCQNGSDLVATITGLTGGTFSSTAGLTISPTSGLIDVSTSTAGTYNVTYTTNGSCPNTNVVAVIITATDDASFTYGGATFCQNGTDPTASVNLSGGTFSSTTGLVINANSGLIDVSASTAGNYAITYVTNGPCPNSSIQNVTITTTGNSSFSYTSASYCQNGTNAAATISGNPGGTFSSTTGLVIDSNSGLITVATSTVGNYVVTYSVTGACPSSSNANVAITAADDASFTYGASSYCQNGSDPAPAITGTTGTFSSTTGLSISASTGVIDVSASTPGTYNVTYTTNGACPNTNIVAVIITATDNASFTYGGATFCQNGSDPSPTGGLPGGTWSSTTGLSIHPTTGAIDVSASTPGNYSVTYTTNGPCPASNSMNIIITATDDASYSYNVTTSCQNGSDLVTSITGLTGGTFTSTTGLTVNSTSGLVDVSASTAGTYDVTYTTNGSCPSSSIISVTITAVDNASFTYGGATFCQNGVDPTPTIGMPGGTFTTTTGLVVNPATGTIDVSASTAGSYNLTYTTNGSCPDFSTLLVTITATGNSSFSYGSSTYCQNVADPMPVVTGNPGGVFTSTAGLVISSSTGEIDLTGSTVGSYTVTYSVTGSCPSTSDTVVTILTADVAAFAYADTVVCLNTGANPILSVSGTTSGTYTSSPVGLVFSNSATGEIDLAASSAGNYVVVYTSNGTCPAIATVNVELSSCLGIETMSLANVNSYKLYPNPNEGSFTLQNTGLSGDLMIRVHDMYGKVIYVQEMYLEVDEQSFIDIPNLVGGLYIVEIQQGEQREIIKMIVSE